MRTLFAKLFLAHLLTLLIALGVVSLLLPSALQRVLSPLYMQAASGRLLADAEHIAGAIEPLAGEPERAEELRRAIRSISATTGLRLCLVSPGTDAESLVQDPSGRRVDQPGPVAGRLPAGETTVARAGVFRCTEDFLVAHWPLPGNKGALLVGASVAAAIADDVARVRRIVFYAGVVAAALSLLVALALSERISGPLRRMTRLATQMASGDFSQRLRIRAGDEVGALGRSFDSLADSLARTLAELQEEQGRLRSILASVGDGIVAVDAKGRVTLLNPQAAALLRLDQDSCLGRHIGELGLPQAPVARFLQCVESGQACEVEFHAGAPERQYVLHVAPVRPPTPEGWGAVGVLRDVTEGRRLEQMRRRFISDASHEIKTPLTAIGGFASAIADGTAATPEQRIRSATLIVREVERLNRLVNDLLDLSRIESGAVQLDLEEVDVPDLIRSAVEAFETQSRERDIEVDVVVPDDLPRARGDSDRLYQVLVNLLSNALRFNRDQGRITIGARCENGFIRVEVSDTGPGIPAVELPHIWERFHRADASRARSEGGTGLGLAIVRSIVEAHGGQVSAESTPGVGSTFTFTVPVG